VGFGAAAFTRFASEALGWLAEPQLARAARLRPVGFGAAAFTRFASEGWWARQGSNL
jgi:hypothetical protein